MKKVYVIKIGYASNLASYRGCLHNRSNLGQFVGLEFEEMTPVSLSDDSFNALCNDFTLGCTGFDWKTKVGSHATKLYYPRSLANVGAHLGIIISFDNYVCVARIGREDIG